MAPRLQQTRVVELASNAPPGLLWLAEKGNTHKRILIAEYEPKGGGKAFLRDFNAWYQRLKALPADLLPVLDTRYIHEERLFMVFDAPAGQFAKKIIESGHTTIPGPEFLHRLLSLTQQFTQVLSGSSHGWIRAETVTVSDGRLLLGPPAFAPGQAADPQSDLRECALLASHWVGIPLSLDAEAEQFKQPWKTEDWALAAAIEWILFCKDRAPQSAGSVIEFLSEALTVPEGDSEKDLSAALDTLKRLYQRSGSSIIKLRIEQTEERFPKVRRVSQSQPGEKPTSEPAPKSEPTPERKREPANLVDTEARVILCCPNPQCRQLVVEDAKRRFCIACGKALQHASLDLWIGKSLKPALESDLFGVLKGANDPIKWAITMGLPGEAAAESRNRCFKEKTGVSRAVLQRWIDDDVEPLLRAKTTTQSAQEQAFLEADEKGIARPCAEALLAQLVQMREFPANSILAATGPSDPILDPELERDAEQGAKTPVTGRAGEKRTTYLAATSPSDPILDPECEPSPERGARTPVIGRREEKRSTFLLPKFAIVAVILIMLAIWLGSRSPALEVVLKADKNSVQKGETVQLTAEVSGVDPRSVTFTWSTTGGRLEGSGPKVRLYTSSINLPDQPSGPVASVPVEVSVTLTDSRGENETAHNTITVQALSRPLEVRLQASSDTVAVRESVNLRVTVAGFDQATTRYLWESSAGSINGNGTEAVLWTSEISGSAPSEKVTVRVRVEDGRGLKADDGIEITVMKRPELTPSTLKPPDNNERIQALLNEAEEMFEQTQYCDALSRCNGVLRLDRRHSAALRLKVKLEETMRILDIRC